MARATNGKVEKLLSKTLRTFTLYSLVVLAASVPAYYYLVDDIWLRELDEHNTIIADRTKNELNRLPLTDTALAESIALWNKIQPGTNLQKATDTATGPDSAYTVIRQNLNASPKTIDRFRGLVRLIFINNKPYLLTVETNVEETEETAIAIAALTLVFFLILVIGFLLLNRRLSVQLWKPFRSTLSTLQNFNLNNQTAVTFERSNTFEFEELNTALGKLLAHSIAVYKTQKEFTENASHELQTPLAIIKNRLDLLLQKETVTDRQYQIVEEINTTLTHISRINKNLLLLARIDNQQFADNEQIDIRQIAEQCLEDFKEHADQKNILVNVDLKNDIIVEGNNTLATILLSNLLLNAIRHNTQNGTINILITKHELCIANSGKAGLNTSAIFKRFAKTSNEHAGSGLGLAIIQQICHRHNWSIDYRFTDNLHTFIIYFK